MTSWLPSAIALLLVLLTSGAAPEPQAANVTGSMTGSITVDLASPGAAIPPTLYGIFFEEINHAGDGGLYAELVRNRGFEDSRLPPACVLDNGFLVPPRTPHFDTGKPNTWRLRWDVTNPYPSWTLETTGGSDARIALSVEHPLHAQTPHSLEINASTVGAGGRVAVLNEGYWGIATTSGAEYRLAFFARHDGTFHGPLTAAIESADGTPLATLTFDGAGFAPNQWRRFEATLRASGTDPKARLALTLGSTGRLWLDMVSLFPAKTFKDRPNGLRPDLAQMIADMKPGFIRAPGGCFAEGITVESRPQWKQTLGPIETRRGTYSPWGYWSTDGFGYHEFLQFAEDIGADALYVVNVGVSCSFRSGTFLPDDQLPALIQDTLDAIEYAVGPPASTWGRVRATAGHPAPFPLKYIEIGNEQQGARYGERVAKFAQAIRAKYPEIKIALSSWIAGIDRRAIDAAAGTIDIVDEHAYKPIHWGVEHFDSFAGYPRPGWDLYIGEFATNAGVGRGNWIAALNDAAYMMSVEKNTDLVKMASYAPLLENVNHRDWPVNMIHFDSSRVFGRATYYVSKLFAEHLPTVALKTDVDLTPAAPAPIAGAVGVGTWNTAAEFTDIRVERDGQVVHQADFTQGARGWSPVTGRGQGSRGVWSAAEGAYRQSQNVVGFSYLGGVSAANATITLRARKISGAEGFLVLAGTADGRRVQWNVAGWSNTQSAIQTNDAIMGGAVRHRVETGRWYDLKLEVRDRTVRGYVDGQLINEATLPRVDTVLAIAGRDDKTGEVVIKAINTAARPASMTINLQNVRHHSTTGRVIVMSSPSPDDENSFEDPKRIVPVERALPGIAPTFTHELPPYSLSILRLGARRQ